MLEIQDSNAVEHWFSGKPSCPVLCRCRGQRSEAVRAGSWSAGVISCVAWSKGIELPCLLPNLEMG